MSSIVPVNLNEYIDVVFEDLTMTEWVPGEKAKVKVVKSGKGNG